MRTVGYQSAALYVTYADLKTLYNVHTVYEGQYLISISVFIIIASYTPFLSCPVFVWEMGTVSLIVGYQSAALYVAYADLQTLSLQDMVRRRAPCSTPSQVCTPSLTRVHHHIYQHLPLKTTPEFCSKVEDK